MYVERQVLKFKATDQFVELGAISELQSSL